MLFNSYEFIFVFLPVTLLLFFVIGGRGYHRAAIAWVVAASLFFYAWWNPVYLGLILASVLFNYAVGVALAKNRSPGARNGPEVRPWPSRGVLAFGVAANLGLLGYFKYAGFFLDNWNAATGSEVQIDPIVLPLAISFFTFQQIAYLVDAYRGETDEYNFLHYCLFVTFFPQLIAGPIVHHKEMLPQFARRAIYRLQHEHLAIGLTIFFLGLFKKIVLADSAAAFANPVFAAAEDGVTVTFFEAWGGALAYTFQLYFDFSGYSDMAIGLGRMFGIRLPLNFNSPYKARNIVEFWRRWHMTLSRFLRDYLYIALGGNRRGTARRYLNLMATMVLGGLWHGAGWTFVAWGSLHGAFLAINHGWRALRRALGQDLDRSSWWGRGCARSITFAAVVLAWVFFRAESFRGATHLLGSMVGLNGIAIPKYFAGRVGALQGWIESLGGRLDGALVVPLERWMEGFPLVIFLLLVAWFAPNTQQFMRRYRPAFETYRGEIDAQRWKWLQWRMNFLWALLTAGITGLALTGLFLSEAVEFLYFNF